MRNTGTAEPLKPADFHILLALADGPSHGYEIMKTVSRESGGRVRLEVGTLYRILARLFAEGLIEESEPDMHRRKYRLTRPGQRGLAAEARRLAGVVDGLRRRKLLPPSEA